MTRVRDDRKNSNTMKRAGERSKRVVIRCSEDEKQRWEAMAEERGKTLSDLVRERLDRTRTRGLSANQDDVVRLVMLATRIERMRRHEIVRQGEVNGGEPGSSARDEVLQCTLFMQNILAKYIT